MTEIDAILLDAVLPEPVTVRVALELVGPLNAIPPAVMVVVPGPTAVAMPEALTVATAGALEVQVTPLVMVCVVGCFALPYVPTTVNCAVCPTVKDCVVGVT
jgi:hypothetical protein